MRGEKESAGRSGAGGRQAFPNCQRRCARPQGRATRQERYRTYVVVLRGHAELSFETLDARVTGGARAGSARVLSAPSRVLDPVAHSHCRYRDTDSPNVAPLSATDRKTSARWPGWGTSYRAGVAALAWSKSASQRTSMKDSRSVERRRRCQPHCAEHEELKKQDDSRLADSCSPLSPSLSRRVLLPAEQERS